MSGYQPTFNPFSSEMSPTSPLEGPKPPVTTGTNFKVNVNRNKTRRWVTARAYTYDGDDWGSDSDEEGDVNGQHNEEEQRNRQQREELERQRRFNSIQRRIGRRTDDTTLPQLLVPGQEQGAPLKRNSGVYQESIKRTPLLHSPVSAPAVPPSASASASASASGGSAPLSSSSSPNKGIERPSNGGRVPFIRPVDIYRRMEEDRLKQQQQQQGQQTSQPPYQGYKPYPAPISAPADAPSQAQVERQFKTQTQAQAQTQPQGQQQQQQHSTSNYGRQPQQQVQQQQQQQPQQVPRLESNTRDATSHFHTSSSSSPTRAKQVIRVSPPNDAHIASSIAQIDQQAGAVPHGSSASGLQPRKSQLLRKALPAKTEQQNVPEQAQQAYQHQERQQQPPPSASRSPTAKQSLHTSGSRGFRSVVHQAFDTGTPPDSATTPNPLDGPRPGMRSDSTATYISPILPSGAFQPTPSTPIPSSLGIGGTISEEPENIDGEGTQPSAYEIPTAKQRVSPVPGVKIGHRRKMTPPDTQPGAERKTVVMETPVRMCSIPAQYGYANTADPERDDTLQSGSDVFSTPLTEEPEETQKEEEEQQQQQSQEQQQQQQGHGGERQSTEQSSVSEGQFTTAQQSPAGIKRMSTLDQTVLDLSQLIEEHQDAARKAYEANTDDENEHGHEDSKKKHGGDGDGDTPATNSSSTPYYPPSIAAHTIANPPAPPHSPPTSQTSGVETFPQSPPSLRISTDLSKEAPMPHPTISLVTPTSGTPHTASHDEAESPYETSLLAQQNAQLENEIILSLTPKQGPTPVSGRSNSNASSVSVMRLGGDGAELSTSPNWKTASVATSVGNTGAVDGEQKEKDKDQEKEKGAALTPVHEEMPQVRATQAKDVLPTASPRARPAGSRDPKTFSTIISSAKVWGGGQSPPESRSQGLEAQNGLAQSAIPKFDQLTPRQNQNLASPTQDAMGKRRSLVLTELPDGLGYVEQSRPQLSHKFSWEMDAGYTPGHSTPAPEKAAAAAATPVSAQPQPSKQSDLPTAAEQSITSQTQPSSDDFEASTLASLTAVQSELSQGYQPSQTSVRPTSSYGNIDQSKSIVPTIAPVSSEPLEKTTLSETTVAPHQGLASTGASEGDMNQRPSEKPVAQSNTDDLGKSKTTESDRGYSLEDPVGSYARSDFSFVPSRANTPAPPFLPPRPTSILEEPEQQEQQQQEQEQEQQQSPKTTSSRPQTAQTQLSKAPTAASASTFSPTRSISSSRPPTKKLRSFGSISALTSSAERCEAYRIAQEEAAHVDSGLENWLKATLAAFPEHSDLVNPKSRNSQVMHLPQRNLSSRTFNKIALSSSHHVRQMSGTGFAHMIHSQQLNHKGKDLLHSAGGAAKGLFSRGKNRFRHVGSAETAN